ncbi:radical SAM family heme chaperone HemW [Chloroflexota bacterium]
MLASSILFLMNPNSIYIHIPFCLHRCAYCDFNTYAGMANKIPEYVNALQFEARFLGDVTNERLGVHTIYFGGGTPSLLPVFLIEKILNTLDDCFKLEPDIEISLEANPGTLSLSYLKDLNSAGVNRLSLGVQSAHSQELSFLERVHRFDDVLDSVRWVRQSRINNLSLDLIFGLPEQTIEEWDKSLTKALNLAPEHFSLYALTIEEGTPLHSWATRGLVSNPDPDLVAKMYELAGEKLSTAGYVQYEISSWARANDDYRMNYVEGESRKNKRLSNIETPLANIQWACRHNLQYWRNESYIGIGAGAHGFVGGYRLSNVLTPIAYIRRMNQTASFPKFPRTPATDSIQSIDQQTEMNETLMMGLRLTQEGISRTDFQERFKQDLNDVFGHQIDKLIGWKLLEWVGTDKEILRLTSSGRLLGNQVFIEFV